MLAPQNDLKLLELAGEIHRTLESKRWIYFWSQVAVLLGISVTYYFQIYQPVQELYITYLYPLLFLLLLTNTLWHLLGGSLLVAERLGIVIVPVVTLAHSISFVLRPNIHSHALYINTGPYWTLIMCAFVLLMALPLKVALRVLVPLSLIVFSLPWLVNANAFKDVLTAVVRAQASATSVLVMMIGLAWYRQHFTEQATAALLLRRLVLTDLIAQTGEAEPSLTVSP